MRHESIGTHKVHSTLKNRFLISHVLNISLIFKWFTREDGQDCRPLFDVLE